MDWYITKELIGPFLFGVGLFTSVAVTVGALFELVRRVAESGLPYGAALEITDRAYIMRDGQILASGAEEELYSNPLVRQYYLGDNFVR